MYESLDDYGVNVTCHRYKVPYVISIVISKHDTTKF